MNIIYSYLFHGLLPVTEIVFIPTDQVEFQIMHLIFYTVTLSEIKLFKYNTVCNMYIAIVISNISNHICFCYSWWRTIQNNLANM